MESQPYIFSDAVRYFWQTRELQSQRQSTRGVADTGARGAVTGGLQMGGFSRRIVDGLVGAGVSPSHIFTQRGLSDLPGFYRPTKEWDIVVVDDGRLLAAIELKSQVGPSFGNNFNNRIEEAMGSAVDIWTAYREGAFRLSPQPWLGYLLLVEDCEQSRRPVSLREPHFSAFEEFRQTSYLQRYELFCLKLVRERQYNAACFLTARREEAEATANYVQPSAMLSDTSFLTQLTRHVQA